MFKKDKNKEFMAFSKLMTWYVADDILGQVSYQVWEQVWEQVFDQVWEQVVDNIWGEINER